MSRSVVFALVLSLASTTPALASETLLQSATRATQALAQAQALPSNAVEAKRGTAAVERYAETLTADGKRSRGRLQAAQAQQTQPGLEAAGMRKRTKLLIAIGSAAAFAAVAYAIDHGVTNSTPSTLNTRKD